eukprot:CAMPEP_0197192408 /NCGR_PEP_ID=MMETSP1423-20130617/25023_1 /TAXON_ID=476441 /ORGANISM="Pseudo-nitzschia heimii, Strain UNC1101" /LENGTH=986 /DNA_ID=CAMNT_0042645279 /DNA_START=141 /DNA_END=3101 /DNA_ORIENTATION=+
MSPASNARGTQLRDQQQQQQQQKAFQSQENGKKRKRPQNGNDVVHKKPKNRKQNQQTADNDDIRSNKNDSSIDSIFGRVIERRQEEIKRLEAALVMGLLMDIRELSGTELPSLAAARSSPSTNLSSGIEGSKAAREVRKLVLDEYKKIRNVNILPNKRRKAWEIVNGIFGLIDTLTGKSDKLETNAGATANPSTSRIGATENEEISPTELPLLPSKDQSKITGKSNKISNDNDVSNTTSSTLDPAPGSVATTNTITNLIDPKLRSTAKAGEKMSVSETSNSETAIGSQSAPSSPKRKSFRTVASLSSASALTTATAADNANSSTSNPASRNIRKKDPPIHPSMLRGTVPSDAVPPPYQKRSLTVQQHRDKKLHKSQQLQHQTKNSAVVHRANTNHNDETANTAQMGTRKSPYTSKPPNLPDITEPPAKTATTATTSALTTTCRTTAVISGTNNNMSSEASLRAHSTSVTPTVAESTSPNTAAAPSQTAAAIVSASSSSTCTESSSGSNAKTNSNANASAKTSSPPAKSLRIQFDPDVPDIMEQPIISSTTTSVALMPDDSKAKPTRFGCYIEDRPWVQLAFKPYSATSKMTNQFLNRLRKWEPFWISETEFCTGLTSPVINHKYRKGQACKYTPQTAASFDVSDLLKIAGPKIRTIANGQTPVDGELRVLIRMLPLYLSKQKDGGKNRADVHLWPKGTYMQIQLNTESMTCPKPQMLYQRKQQSHDPTKWLGICKQLDITSMVHELWASTTTSLKHSSRNSRIEIGCYDAELYMFNLALCRYRSPQTLSKMLLNVTDSRMFKRVGLEEMYERVKKKTEVLDCDSEGDDKIGQSDMKTPDELQTFDFPIRDPFTLAAIENPVRGKNCLHLTCFGLNSFLDLNKSPSGQRWKCGNCDKFLSYVDLEHCSLTELASKRFGDQIGPLQYRVELRADRSMALCKASRSHQERARARKAAADARSRTKNDSKTIGIVQGTNEVVELLDSDSD